MTLQIGLLDKKNRKTYVAADGVITQGSTIVRTDYDKIVQVSPNLLIGWAGYALKGDVLRAFPERITKDIHNGNFAAPYKLRQNLISLFEEHAGFSSDYAENNGVMKEWEGQYVIALYDRLYETGPWFTPSVPTYLGDGTRYQIATAGSGSYDAEIVMKLLYSKNTEIEPTALIEEAFSFVAKHDTIIGPSTATVIKSIEW